MIHYTCDRCRRRIDTETELRYQVDVVTQVVLDGSEISEETERDHLGELDELLQRIDDDACEQLCEELYQSRRFDLCCDCYQQYSKNPLGADSTLTVGFSEN